MDYNQRLKELNKEIETIKIIQHNNGMNGAAKPIVENLKRNMTKAELKFQEIFIKKGFKFKPQHRINIISKKGRIIRFYVADFCDIKNKIVFEIDGEYHEDANQQKKDLKRTKDLCKMGYRVFRITNSEVFAGKTTQLLYSAYPNLK
jgi:very-short-patch-repair endonuclease